MFNVRPIAISSLLNGTIDISVLLYLVSSIHSCSSIRIDLMFCITKKMKERRILKLWMPGIRRCKKPVRNILLDGKYFFVFLRFFLFISKRNKGKDKRGTFSRLLFYRHVRKKTDKPNEWSKRMNESIWFVLWNEFDPIRFCLSFSKLFCCERKIWKLSTDNARSKRLKSLGFLFKLNSNLKKKERNWKHFIEIYRTAVNKMQFALENMLLPAALKWLELATEFPASIQKAKREKYASGNGRTTKGFAIFESSISVYRHRKITERKKCQRKKCERTEC